MRLLIVRHGETTANKKRVTSGGGNNSPLTKLGKEQSQKLARRLAKEKINIIYCSDLKRTKQTLKPYLKQKNKKTHYTKLLREQHLGRFEGKPGRIMREWFEEHPGKDPKGWETKTELKKRVTKFITQKLKRTKEKNVLIITHGRTKKMLLKVLLEKQKDQDLIYEKNSPNTGLTIIKISENKIPKLKLLNNDKHLK